MQIQPKVVDAGHHSRPAPRLTGLDVEENQAAGCSTTSTPSGWRLDARARARSSSRPTGPSGSTSRRSARSRRSCGEASSSRRSSSTRCSNTGGTSPSGAGRTSRPPTRLRTMSPWCCRPSPTRTRWSASTPCRCRGGPAATAGGPLGPGPAHQGPAPARGPAYRLAVGGVARLSVAAGVGSARTRAKRTTQNRAKLTMDHGAPQADRPPSGRARPRPGRRPSRRRPRCRPATQVMDQGGAPRPGGLGAQHDHPDEEEQPQMGHRDPEELRPRRRRHLAAVDRPVDRAGQDHAGRGRLCTKEGRHPSPTTQSPRLAGTAHLGRRCPRMDCDRRDPWFGADGTPAGPSGPSGPSGSASAGSLRSLSGFAAAALTPSCRRPPRAGCSSRRRSGR